MSRFKRPAVMGVLNVTPDSFSDGGNFLDPVSAIAHARSLSAQGADLVDVGGESTRPGSEPVAEREELARVMPVLEEVARSQPCSIDTGKAEVARRALAAGAQMVNDVTALRGDPDMVQVVAEAGVEVCLMHMLGEPKTMQENPQYVDVVSDVKGFLEERLEFATREGVREERIWLDPGIGFGKSLEHNLALLSRLDEIVAIGRPVLIGASRKRFIGALTGKTELERGPGSLAANLIAFERGASMFRVHDVSETRDALLVAAATLEREPSVSDLADNSSEKRGRITP